MQLLEAAPNNSPAGRQLSEAGRLLAHVAKTSPRLAAALVTDELLRAVLELPASLEPGCLSMPKVRASSSGLAWCGPA